MHKIRIVMKKVKSLLIKREKKSESTQEFHATIYPQLELLTPKWMLLT